MKNGADGTHDGGAGARASDVAVPSNAVAQLAVARLATRADGIAQAALHASLAWTSLLVPVASGDHDEAVVRRASDGTGALVGFTHEGAARRWVTGDELACAVEPARGVARRAVAQALAGIMLDPRPDGAGILLPVTVLAALAADGRIERDAREDDLALRLAIDTTRESDTPLAHLALREALLHGTALVPLTDSPADPMLRTTLDPDTHERIVIAYSDREALLRGRRGSGGQASLLTGRALLETVIDHELAALVLNPDDTGAVRLPLADVTDLARRPS